MRATGAGTGDEAAALAGEVDFRQARRARIRAALAALAAQAAADAVVPGAAEAPHLLGPEPPAPEEGTSVSPPPLTVVPPPSVLPAEEAASTPPAVRPDAKDQYNCTDAASQILPSTHGFVQAYNGQAAVDHYRQSIVACDVTDACTDPPQLRPLLDQVRPQTGSLPETYSAATG
jgi:hypothetical protein